MTQTTGLTDSQNYDRIHTHTHPFNGLLSGTTQVSWYQKGKTDLDFTEARDSEWQWHQLGHMQICTSLQTDNHASTHCFLQAGCPSCHPTNNVKALKELYILSCSYDRIYSTGKLSSSKKWRPHSCQAACVWDSSGGQRCQSAVWIQAEWPVHASHGLHSLCPATCSVSFSPQRQDDQYLQHSVQPTCLLTLSLSLSILLSAMFIGLQCG